MRTTNSLTKILVSELEDLRTKALYTTSLDELENILKATEIQNDIFHKLYHREMLTYNESKLVRAINISITAICRIRKEME